MTAAAANEPTLERGAALEDQLAGGVQRAGDGAEDDRVLAQPALGDLRRQRRQLGEPAFERRAQEVEVAADAAAQQDELGVEDRGDGPDDQRQPLALGLDRRQ